MKRNSMILALTLLLAGGLSAGDGQVQQEPAFSPPLPVGGMASLGEQIKYPAGALRDSLEGQVNLQVQVDAAGRVMEILVQQPVRADLDSAAVRAVRAAAWQPGRSGDEAVACTVVVPVRFKIDHKP